MQKVKEMVKVNSKEEPKLEDIPAVGPGLPGYVAPKVEAAPAAAPAQPAAPADVTNIQFD